MESFDNDTGTPGFVRNSCGEFTIIDIPGAAITEAHGINDMGQIVGDFGGNGQFRSFLRDITGNFTTIEFPGVSGIGSAFGINNSGSRR